MLLGIEIGGTKLQLGVSERADADFAAFERFDIDAARGATGILEQIERGVATLAQSYSIDQIGVGFGGPVDSARGVTTKSHQVEGWDAFPLAAWLTNILKAPAVIGNDCDVAALAEATRGAGRSSRSTFYVTVGTGIGGGYVVDGKLQGAGRPASAEIGHLRPGPHADRPDETVESLASGWGIVAAAQKRISGEVTPPLDSIRGQHGPQTPLALKKRIHDVEQADQEYVRDLLNRCNGDIDSLTAKQVAQAASEGNQIATAVIQHAIQTLGWAIAQVITLLAPETVVVGGGVSLIGEQMFFAPLREQVARYVFPPLAKRYRIVPAELGEAVVVHGAIALAAQNSPA